MADMDEELRRAIEESKGPGVQEIFEEDMRRAIQESKGPGVATLQRDLGGGGYGHRDGKPNQMTRGSAAGSTRQSNRQETLDSQISRGSMEPSRQSNRHDGGYTRHDDARHMAPLPESREFYQSTLEDNGDYGHTGRDSDQSATVRRTDISYNTRDSRDSRDSRARGNGDSRARGQPGDALAYGSRVSDAPRARGNGDSHARGQPGDTLVYDSRASDAPHARGNGGSHARGQPGDTLAYDSRFSDAPRARGNGGSHARGQPGDTLAYDSRFSDAPPRHEADGDSRHGDAVLWQVPYAPRHEARTSDAPSRHGGTRAAPADGTLMNGPNRKEEAFRKEKTEASKMESQRNAETKRGTESRRNVETQRGTESRRNVETRRGTESRDGGGSKPCELVFKVPNLKTDNEMYRFVFKFTHDTLMEEVFRHIERLRDQPGNEYLKSCIPAEFEVQSAVPMKLLGVHKKLTSEQNKTLAEVGMLTKGHPHNMIQVPRLVFPGERKGTEEDQ